MKTDEVVWITGATSGIGEAVARRLSKSGVSLALSARRADHLEALALELSERGESKAVAFPMDVTEKAAHVEVAKSIEDHFGSPVTVLIPCAGSYTPSDSAADFKSEEHEHLMRLNYFSLLYGVEAVLPSMKEMKRGRIVGVASLVGYFGLPRAVGYSASKAAIINCLQSLRFELRGLGITVQVVNPGFVKTPLTDKNDFPMPCLIPVEKAAEQIERHLASSRFECHFPLGLSLPFKVLRFLPQPLFEWIIAKIVYRDREGVSA